MSDRRFTDEPFTVRLQHRNGVVRVHLSGALDIVGAARLGEELSPLSEEAPEAVLLDARGVTFINSSGLRALLKTFGSTENGPPMAVVGLSHPLERLLELAGASVPGRHGFELLRRFSGEEAS